MNVTGLFPTLFCFSIAFIPLVIIGIYGTRDKIRYVTFTNELRRKGKYTEWANNNRVLLFLEHFSLYAFLTSFLGFIIFGILKLEDIARFLFVCFIVTCFSAVTLSFILYQRAAKE